MVVVGGRGGGCRASIHFNVPVNVFVVPSFYGNFKHALRFLNSSINVV